MGWYPYCGEREWRTRKRSCSFCSGVLSILADISFGYSYAFGVGLLGKHGTVDSSHWIMPSYFTLKNIRVILSWPTGIGSMTFICDTYKDALDPLF